MKSIVLTLTVLLATTIGASAQRQQGQNGQYCLVTEGGGQNCGFASRAQCEKARTGVSHEPCFRNPQAPRATTGSGTRR
jgi:hypothetical protein